MYVGLSTFFVWMYRKNSICISEPDSELFDSAKFDWKSVMERTKTNRRSSTPELKNRDPNNLSHAHD